MVIHSTLNLRFLFHLFDSDKIGIKRLGLHWCIKNRHPYYFLFTLFFFSQSPLFYLFKFTTFAPHSFTGSSISPLALTRISVPQN